MYLHRFFADATIRIDFEVSTLAAKKEATIEQSLVARWVTKAFLGAGILNVDGNCWHTVLDKVEQQQQHTYLYQEIITHSLI